MEKMHHFDKGIYLKSSIINPLLYHAGIKTIEDIYKFDEESEIPWTDISCLGVTRIRQLSDTLVENGYKPLTNWVDTTTVRTKPYISIEMSNILKDIYSLIDKGNTNEAKEKINELLS